MAARKKRTKRSPLNLISKKKLHARISNPTLFGYEAARAILDSMGCGYVSFNDHHFGKIVIDREEDEIL
jgi:hypothetical protein